MYSKEEAHSQIAALVERFTEQLPSYKKSDYNETLTRRDFIDPFFKALGWDMNNSAGKVIHEDKIKIGNATKAPDQNLSFTFRSALEVWLKVTKEIQSVPSLQKRTVEPGILKKNLTIFVRLL